MNLIRHDQLDLLAPCTNAEARELTDRIKAAVEQVWALLLEAHERDAWSALGYTTWEEYVRGEFHMSRRRSYQLLDQGRVIRAIGETVCTDVHTVSPAVEVTEAEARDIKPVLPAVVEAVRDRVSILPEPEPERVRQIVHEEVEKARSLVRERQEERRENEDFVRRHQPAGFDAAADGELVRQRGALSRLTEDLVGLGDPAEFASSHRGWLRDNHIARAEAAAEWLDDFLAAWRDT